MQTLAMTQSVSQNPYWKGVNVDADVQANAELCVSFFSFAEADLDYAHWLLAAVFSHLNQSHTCLPLSKLRCELWFAGDVEGDEETVKPLNTEMTDNDDRQSAQIKTIPYPGIQFSDNQKLSRVLNVLTDPACKYAFVIRFEALYLGAMDELEQCVASHIQRFNKVNPLCAATKAHDLLSTLFANQVTNNAQALAVANALYRQFSIINGGPGTGKTYTAARVLCGLLLSMHRPRIALVAPTGKAAQRLLQSLQQATEVLSSNPELSSTVEALPKQATTIHRLLGASGRGQFARFNQDNPLPYDVILVDEVSMLDIALTNLLLQACRSSTRIIWLGDAAQLPSVQVGSVLADLLPTTTSSPTFQVEPSDATWLSTATHSHVVEAPDYAYGYVTTLTTNYRSDSVINQISRAMLAADPNATLQYYRALHQQSAQPLPDVLLWQSRQYSQDVQTLLKEDIAVHFKALKKCASVQDAFTLLHQLRILLPQRKGRFGINTINKTIISQIEPKADVQSPWFKGLPLIIEKNDPLTKVNNGDIAIVWPNVKGELVAYVDRGLDRPIELNRYRLPTWSPVYAMTVHKSQGSEFEEVLIILPQEHNALCHRELLFTAVTRAKSSVRIAATRSVIEQTLALSQQRDSHLFERLH
jgi:exodeoxyribonuclease V alpha subunit